MANKKFIIDGERVIQQSPDGTLTYTIDWSGDMSKLLDFFKTLPLM